MISPFYKYYAVDICSNSKSNNRIGVKLTLTTMHVVIKLSPQKNAVW